MTYRPDVREWEEVTRRGSVVMRHRVDAGHARAVLMERRAQNRRRIVERDCLTGLHGVQALLAPQGAEGERCED